jgi:hypothetical protein
MEIAVRAVMGENNGVIGAVGRTDMMSTGGKSLLSAYCRGVGGGVPVRAFRRWDDCPELLTRPSNRGRVNPIQGIIGAAIGRVSKSRACTGSGDGPKYQEGISGLINRAELPPAYW